MRWRIANVCTTVEGATDAEEAWLRDFMSYERKTYKPYSGKYVFEQVSLYHPTRNTFPTGFARLAWDKARELGHAVEVADERRRPCEPDARADLEWLRHHPSVKGEITHQIEAVQAAAKNKRGIVWVPTAGGKTEIAIGIATLLPCRFLFMVHRLDLLQQTADRYKLRTGRPVGLIGDGQVDLPDDCQFVVATFQTMNAAVRRGREEVLAILRSVEGLIIDESHCLPASTYIAVTNLAVEAYYRFGLSGTPMVKSPDRNMLTLGGLGPVIYRIRPDALMDIGLLARPTIRMVEVHQLCERPTWHGAYTESIVQSKTRNAAVVAAVAQAEKPALVFVQRVDHGRILEERLRRSGLQVEFTWGEDDTAERRAAIQRLVRGDTEVLVCNVIFQEGVDIPSLRSVVVATGGASPVAALQRIGRGMRADAKTDKTNFEVWDFADKGCGCRGAHTGCRWLERHAKARAKAYRDEGFEVEEITEDGQMELPADAA